MNVPPGGKLERFFAFFEKYGTERLNGLDESYFDGMSPTERAEAWNFLAEGFQLSTDKIKGLFVLDKISAVELFKKEVDSPIPSSPYATERQSLQSDRLLMLRCIYNVDPDEKYIAAMTEFSNSEFDEIRGEFADSLPASPVTHSAVDALKRMIFTEAEKIPLSFAIMKLMSIHGLVFDSQDSIYKSIYMALASNDVKDKIAGMERLERHQLPAYVE